MGGEEERGGGGGGGGGGESRRYGKLPTFFRWVWGHVLLKLYTTPHGACDLRVCPPTRAK